MRILNDRSFPRTPRRTSSDNDCIQEMIGAAKAAKLVKLLRSAAIIDRESIFDEAVLSYGSARLFLGLVFKLIG